MPLSRKLLLYVLDHFRQLCPHNLLSGFHKSGFFYVNFVSCIIQYFYKNLIPQFCVLRDLMLYNNRQKQTLVRIGHNICIYLMEKGNVNLRCLWQRAVSPIIVTTTRAFRNHPGT